MYRPLLCLCGKWNLKYCNVTANHVHLVARVILLECIVVFRAFLNTDTNPSLHLTTPAQPGTLHLSPWPAMYAVVLVVVFTIPAELLIVRLAAGLEHGRVYANVGRVHISDLDCNVPVGVMFCFAYFSVVFYIHKIYMSRRKHWCLLMVCHFHVQNCFYSTMPR